MTQMTDTFVRFRMRGKSPVKAGWQNLEESEFIPEGANYGIQTGARSGIFVIDVDIKNGIDGLANLLALDTQKVGLPRTRTVLTPTGGLHLYFKYPNFRVYNSVSILAPGVDTRADGGCVVGPGSRYPKPAQREFYELVEDIDPAEAPQWLLDELQKPPVVKRGPSQVEFQEDLLAYSKAVDFLKTAPICVEGQNGSGTLWQIALKLVRTLQIHPSKCLDLMQDYNSRCQPPWSKEELEHKLWDAAEKSDLPTGYAPDWFEALGSKQKKMLSGDVDSSFKVGEAVLGPEVKLSKLKMSDVIHALQHVPPWQGVFRWDLIRNAVVAINPPIRLECESGGLTENDVFLVQHWLEVVGNFQIHDLTLMKCINAVAKEHTFNPIQDYIQNLPPQSPALLDNLSMKLFGNPEPLSNEMLKRTLVGAIRRALNPGCQMDTVLVLVGQQGLRKSSFVAQLFGEWYRSQMPDISGRDASHALQGYWGVELSELDRIARAENSTVKDFLSRRVDDYRQFGNRDQIRAPRHNIFVGTTNDETLLRDPTGNRRFWPIEVKHSIPTIDRDVIWAAAYALAQKDYPHYFDAEMEAELDRLRQPFVEEDVWKEDILGYLKTKKKEWVTTSEVLGFAVQVKTENKDVRAQRRCAAALKSLGCLKQYKWQDDRSVCGWKVPVSLWAKDNVVPLVRGS